MCPLYTFRHTSCIVGTVEKGRSILTDSGGKFMLFWDLRTGETRYHWRLRGAGSVTVSCPANGYADKSECVADIEYVKNGYPDAPVVDLTVTRY
jgi:uncharacterized protein YegP (UPF0339 family)